MEAPQCHSTWHTAGVLDDLFVWAVTTPAPAHARVRHLEPPVDIPELVSEAGSQSDWLPASYIDSYFLELLASRPESRPSEVRPLSEVPQHEAEKLALVRRCHSVGLRSRLHGRAQVDPIGQDQVAEDLLARTSFFVAVVQTPEGRLFSRQDLGVELCLGSWSKPASCRPDSGLDAFAELSAAACSRYPVLSGQQRSQQSDSMRVGSRHGGCDVVLEVYGGGSASVVEAVAGKVRFDRLFAVRVVSFRREPWATPPAVRSWTAGDEQRLKARDIRLCAHRLRKMPYCASVCCLSESPVSDDKMTR
ncbi:unnamed protein product [Polarella glacialis]|uniref:Uncharacterized protein n=1 Tax=Polarella glacialis TaxID=89957 RepID=A0A813KWI6_POLGL|nr:unnamed protein product [Polarella glacialis]